MITTTFSLKRQDRLFLGYANEHKARTYKFIDMPMQGTMYLIIDSPIALKIPLSDDYKIVQFQSMMKECETTGQITDEKSDGSIIAKSRVFTVVVAKSLDDQDIPEVTDPSLDAIYDQYHEAYLQMQAQYEVIKNAYESGELKGDDGYSPTVEIVEGEDEHTINITDKDGTKSTVVKDGSDAEVTEENIKNALGYTPANEDDIPSKTSQLTNDSGFLTEHQSLNAYRKATDQDAIDSALTADIAKQESNLETEVSEREKQDSLLEKMIKSLLPSWTVADEGKVLGIQNGVLAWVEGGTKDMKAKFDSGSTFDNGYYFAS